MKKFIFAASVILISTAFASFTNHVTPPENGSSNAVAKVEVKKLNGQYQLMRNGEPYFIKGAGGYKYYERLKELGGNSVRIWSTDGEDAKKYLDKAHELGLTVTLGLDMGHERKGF